MIWILAALATLVLVTVAYDLLQKQHAILRNFPVIGHFRYLLEAVGPELRQYIVTSNNEEKPFSRDERSWVYASAKKQNNYFGFGTDNDLERAPNHLVVRHSAFPFPTPMPGDRAFNKEFLIPCAKIVGGHRSRPGAFRPRSVVNISAMSFGSLSSAAVQAINQGAKLAKCVQNTGEGGVAPYHLQGGDLIWQLGTGYFGARNEDGTFNLERLVETVQKTPAIKGIEVKLSQGAKPGLGGMLPGEKVTPEISRIRGIPVGKDCMSPSYHSAFSDEDSLLDFVEMLADATGLPVGIKSAVGDPGFWHRLSDLMMKDDRAVDWIAVDGGEGGTGAAPLVFTDHVALPFKIAFCEVYRVFAAKELQDRVVFVGAGRLGFPDKAVFALAMGCDMVNVAREAMLSVGCIQAQRCHTGHCPTGVATQSKWLMRGLDVTSKAARLANYVVTLRKELLWLTRACGVPHPALVRPDQLEMLHDGLGSINMKEHFGYRDDWGLPGERNRAEITRIMADPLHADVGMGQDVLVEQ